jgi:hypothetical protein
LHEAGRVAHLSEGSAPKLNRRVHQRNKRPRLLTATSDALKALVWIHEEGRPLRRVSLNFQQLVARCSFALLQTLFRLEGRGVGRRPDQHLLLLLLDLVRHFYIVQEGVVLDDLPNILFLLFN